MEKYRNNPENNTERRVTLLACRGIGAAVYRIMESDLPAQPITYESPDIADPADSELAETVAIGRMWPLQSRAYDIAEGEVVLAVYDQEKASSPSGLISQELGRSVAVWGHIQFQRSEYEHLEPSSEGNAQLSGVFYLLQNGTVALRYECAFGADLSLEDTARCYQLAKQLGLTERWTDGFIGAGMRANQHRDTIEEIDGATAVRLVSFLGAVISTSGAD